MTYELSRPQSAVLASPSTETTIGWSDARIERLRSLWSDETLSASVIAQRLGITRNAVLGKVHRLGLSNRRPAGAPRIAAPRTPKPSRPRPVKRVAPPPPPPKAGPLAEIGPGLVVHLEDLRGCACHGPVGDPGTEAFRFCGRGALRPPYCEDHRKVAYQPGGPKPVAGLIRRFAGR